MEHTWCAATAGCTTLSCSYTGQALEAPLTKGGWPPEPSDGPVEEGEAGAHLDQAAPPYSYGCSWPLLGYYTGRLCLLYPWFNYVLTLQLELACTHRYYH